MYILVTIDITIDNLELFINPQRERSDKYILLNACDDMLKKKKKIILTHNAKKKLV